MPIVTIPFDFKESDSEQGLVPICINDTDRDGNKIGWGWFNAVVPVADRLRKLARRRLDDVWRVSELTELSVHDLWYEHGENYGTWPEWRLYKHAKWKAEDLRYGSWRVRRGREVALGDLEALLRARGDHAADYERQQIIDLVRRELSKSGRTDIVEILEHVLHGARWEDVAVTLGQEPTACTVNTLQRRFWRAFRLFPDLR